MANRTIAVQVTFNGINEAASSISALQKELRNLKAEQAKADPTSARFKELEENIASVTGELKDLEKQQKAVNQEFQDAKLAAGSYAALAAETKKLTAEFKNMAVGINATQEEYDAVLQRIKENNAEITRLNREMRNSKSIAERFREGAVAAFKDVATAIVAGVGALEGFNAIKGLGELGLDLSRGFAQVNTVAQLSQEELKNLQAQVLETAKDSTANLEEVPGALFKILSATGDVEKSQEILGASLKAAKVGFTDLTSAADAGTNIYGAVKDQVKDVNEVFDVLFRTQKEGVLTFADLAKSIPLVTPSANTLGISFKETAAALATLTKAGVSADIATTQLKAGFSELGNAQKQAGLKSIGVDIFDAEGKIKSFNDIVGQLGKSLDGLTDEQRSAKLAKVGFGQEAVGSILTLTKNIETFGDVTQSVVDGSLGEFDRQLAASGNTADDLKSATNNLKVTLIQELQPAFETTAKGLIGIARVTAQVIGFFLENKGVILLLAAAYAALNAAKIQSIAITIKERAVTLAKTVVDRVELVLTGLRTAATTAYGVAVQLMTGRLTLAAAAQRLFNLAMASNPIGLAVAGATALAGVLLLLINRTNSLTKAEKERARVSKEIQDAVAATNVEIGKETANLELLVRGIKDETKSKEEKKAITDQLIKQYGQYLSDLDKEAIKAGEVEVAYQKIKRAITETIVARQRSEAVEKLFGEQIAKQQDEAFRLGQEFGKTANEVLKLVDEFQKLPPAIQGLAASQKLDEALGIGGIASGLNDAQKEAAIFFQDISARAEQFRKTGFETTNDRITKIAGRTLTPVEASLKSIIDSEKAIDEGLGEIDAKFGILNASGGGTFTSFNEGGNEASLTVEQLEARLQDLQKVQKETSTSAPEWRQQQKDIDLVKVAIERITGATKAHIAEQKKGQKEAEKLAKEELEAAERRNAALLELRRKLSDALVENEDDENQKLLDAENARYIKEFQAATDAADKIILDKTASQSEIEDAQRTGDALLEQIQLEHYRKLNEIAAAGLKAELEAQEKADGEKAAQARRLLDLRLDTIDNELEVEEKNFARRKKLIQLQTELRIRQSELEAVAALKDAKTDEERTAIMENQASERVRILKEQSQQIEEEREKQGPLLSRILGIDKEELAKFADVFKEFGAVLSEAVDQFFAARLEALDKLIEFQQDKIDQVAEAAQQQVDRVSALEERLATATGSRRERLIALIEKERERERALFAEKVKQEKAKIALEKQKAELEAKQSKIRKAQAIAEAVANTAVGITRTIAEVPKVDFGVSTAVLIALYAALGAAQVALISAQKFAKGGKVDGPSHDDGGVTMAVPSQNRYVNLEGGEYVVRKSAVQRNSEILERINRDGHTTSFAIAPRQPYADGGFVATPNFQAINAAVASSNTALPVDKLDEMIELQRRFLDKRFYWDAVEGARRISNVNQTENRARF
jgi:TP901 family phage tail tape measure protein